MQDWQLFYVALGLKATKVANILIEDKLQGIIPRADLSDPELLLDQAPTHIDDAQYLLDLEMRPLFSCAVNKDYEFLNKIWRLGPAWDSCHFFKIFEFMAERQDWDGLTQFLQAQADNINHFYEPTTMQ